MSDLWGNKDEVFTQYVANTSNSHLRSEIN